MRYTILLDGEVRGPYEPWELIHLRGLTRQSQVCPEFEVVVWKDLSQFPELDSLFRLRAAAEGLFLRNRELQERLLADSQARQQLQEHLKSAQGSLAELEAKAQYADARKVKALEEELARVREELTQNRRAALEIQETVRDRELKIQALEETSAWLEEGSRKALDERQEALQRVSQAEAAARSLEASASERQARAEQLAAELAERSKALEASSSALQELRRTGLELETRLHELEVRHRDVEREKTELGLELNAHRQLADEAQAQRSAALEELTRSQQEREEGLRASAELERLQKEFSAQSVHLEERAARLSESLEAKDRELVRYQTHPDCSAERRVLDLSAELEASARRCAQAEAEVERLKASAAAVELERVRLSERLAQKDQGMGLLERAAEESSQRAARAESLLRMHQTASRVENDEQRQKLELAARQLAAEAKLRYDAEGTGQEAADKLKAAESRAAALSAETERLKRVLIQRESNLEMLEARLQEPSPAAGEPQMAVVAAQGPGGAAGVKALEDRLARMEASFGSLGEKLEGIAGKLEAAAAAPRPAPVEQPPAPGTDVRVLEERLAQMESGVDSLGGKLEGVLAKLDAVADASEKALKENKKKSWEAPSLKKQEPEPLEALEKAASRSWIAPVIMIAIASMALALGWLVYKDIRASAPAAAPEPEPQPEAKTAPSRVPFSAPRSYGLEKARKPQRVTLRAVHKPEPPPEAEAPEPGAPADVPSSEELLGSAPPTRRAASPPAVVAPAPAPEAQKPAKSAGPSADDLPSLEEFRAYSRGAAAPASAPTPESASPASVPAAQPSSVPAAEPAPAKRERLPGF